MEYLPLSGFHGLIIINLWAVTLFFSYPNYGSLAGTGRAFVWLQAVQILLNSVFSFVLFQINLNYFID